MLLISSSFVGLGSFLITNSYEAEIEEITFYFGNQLDQLISVANLSRGVYVVKDLELTQIVGGYGYSVKIGGPPPPQPPQTTTLIKPTTSFTASTWTTPAGADVSDNVYAQATANNQITTYLGFGFSIPAGATINQVNVTAEHYEDPSGNRLLRLQISTDGGATFIAINHDLPIRASSVNEGSNTVDVTADTSWTPTKVNNMAVKAWARQTGGGGTFYVRLDYLTVSVKYTVSGGGTSSLRYIVTTKSDKPGLDSANFTLPWGGDGRILYSTSMVPPGVQTLSEIQSGVKRPVVWSYSNSTHISFGMGKRLST